MLVGSMSDSRTGLELLREALGLDEAGSPFPWQMELLDRFRNGDVPERVDIPTGLGKTAVIAIWLVARALEASLPRRLVYVVDRRAIVDQATEVAVHLREWVERDPWVKRALGLEQRALPISTLRGQYVDNREWLEDPTLPAIIVGTVDMVGSRLLFEGYGVSRKMRPYHAGLLGADCLTVLDEAHLVPPFEHLLRAVADETLRPSEGDQACVPRFRLLSLSATMRTRDSQPFGLMDEDLRHEVVRRRLEAKKSLRIERLDEEVKLEEALANHAWRLTDGGKRAARVIVYSDSRDVAQKAKAALERLAKGDKKASTTAVAVDTELFVGGRRVFEREGAKECLKDLGFLAGSKVERKGPVFLFATSAGEVGVDLDADHMACDLVAWERMVQRLGRVNRRGDGEANVVVLSESEPKNIEELLAKSGDRLTDKERRTVDHVRRRRAARKALERLPSNDGEVFDASPGALRDLQARVATDEGLQGILDDATTPEPIRPALTRPLVEAWAMTSLKKHTGRPAIQPWLRGWIKDDPPQTAVVWRTHLPVRAGGPTPRRKEIEDFFEAAPPHTSEILETETFRVVKWIAGRAKSLCDERRDREIAVEGPRLREEDTVAFALDPDGGLRMAFSLGELKSPEDRGGFQERLAGATLVLDARVGGLRDGLLNENEAGVPPTADDGQDWLGEGVVGFRVRSIEAAALVRHGSNWRERLRFASALAEDGEATRWLIVEKWRHDAATEEDRSASNPQLLDEHQAWAEVRARRLAKALGLDDELVEVLALATRLHDEGKRATGWQRAFHAPRDGVYAKTEGPIDYRLLDGYRHELGSLLRVQSDERILKLSEEHRDLVLHLIAAHHGFARPVIGTGGCEDRPPSILEERAAEIALRFARLQDRWGPWGLAWWEALLRAADQQASRDNDQRDGAGGGV